MIEKMVESDFAQVRELHEKMGHDYTFPDLTSPLVLVKQVARVRGKVVGAAALRLQAETFLWLDMKASRALRLEIVLALSRALVAEAWRVGLDCLVAWLPPGLSHSFHSTLKKRLGWLPARDGWITWYKDIS